MLLSLREWLEIIRWETSLDGMPTFWHNENRIHGPWVKLVLRTVLEGVHRLWYSLSRKPVRSRWISLIYRFTECSSTTTLELWNSESLTHSIEGGMDAETLIVHVMFIYRGFHFWIKVILHRPSTELIRSFDENWSLMTRTSLPPFLEVGRCVHLAVVVVHQMGGELVCKC